jgi:flagellar protein FlaF
MKILSGSGDIADLIEINQSIMMGLSGASSGQAAGEGI